MPVSKESERLILCMRIALWEFRYAQNRGERDMEVRQHNEKTIAGNIEMLRGELAAMEGDDAR